MSKFYSKIGEIKLGKKGQFAKSRNGEYIFTIGNKMVYTDGRYNNPSINSVVDIIVKSKDANEISTIGAFIQEDIKEYERDRSYTGGSFEESSESIIYNYEDVCNTKINVERYQKSDYEKGTFHEQQREKDYFD